MGEALDTRRFKIRASKTGPLSDEEKAAGHTGYRVLPPTEETIEVSVNWGYIVQLLGEKAVASRGGKSGLGSGIIRVKHLRK